MSSPSPSQPKSKSGTSSTRRGRPRADRRRRAARPRMALLLPLESERMAELFRAVSDPTRQRILIMLDKGELNASEIVRAFNLSQSTISRHLSVLRHAGLVKARRKGKQVIYGLECDCVIGCCTGFFGRMSCCAPLFRPGPHPSGCGVRNPEREKTK